MKNLIKLVAMFVLLSGTAMSQVGSKPDAKQPTADKNGVYQTVEEMPLFPGGQEALMNYVRTNLKYPEQAKTAKILGKVFVSFVVNAEGKVTDAKIIRGIGGGCDEEAQRITQSMPDWKPGRQNGKNVAVQFNLPILFKLDNVDGPGIQKNNLK